MKNKLKIGVLVSGGGTNLQAIINGIDDGSVPAEITCVISNNKNAYALERAKKHGIYNVCVRKKDFETIGEYEAAMVRELKNRGCELITLAGFLVVPGIIFLEAFKNKIINVHCSLIPAFCGKGFYGLRVHEAVIERGCKVTGATVHFCDETIDGGPIILQKAVEVKGGDTPEILQKRVMEEAEHIILPKAIKLIAENKVIIENNTTRIRKCD